MEHFLRKYYEAKLEELREYTLQQVSDYYSEELAGDICPPDERADVMDMASEIHSELLEQFAL